MVAKRKHSVLFIRNGEAQFETLMRVLRETGYSVDTVGNAAQTRRMLGNSRYRGVIADLSMRDIDGAAVLRATREAAPKARVVFIAGPQQEEEAKKLVDAGATGYFIPPFDSKAVALLLSSGTTGNDPYPGFYGIVGNSPAIRSVVELIRKVADTSSTVLVSGESGSGKELVARAVHLHGEHAKDPFVVVHCGAIPETLLESELFGHQRGAFTGAYTTKEGLFQSARAGTVFLDEIAEVTPATQVKLLRVLESGLARPVGAVKDIEVAARVIAATNRDLQQLVRQGTFREDLFYRLNVFPIRVPPLRERKEDIALLARLFLDRISEDRDAPPIEIDRQAMDFLLRYSWPGNIRELENVIERAAILSGGGPVTPQQLPPEVRTPAQQPASIGVFDMPFRDARNTFERSYVRRVLDRCNGNVARAARTAGMSRAYFYEIIKKYGVKQ